MSADRREDTTERQRGRPGASGRGAALGMSLHLATTDAGNALLERDPLALMIGMMLDQQVPMEKAFTSPSVLAERLGVERLDAAAITSMPPDELVELFKTPPALHRFPGSMAARAQQLCQAVVADWDGDAANVWAGAESGAELVRRLGTLPGFGAQKARIFAALLAKRLGVRPDGWQEATGDYGLDGYRSIADIIDEASKGKVREYKKAMKARAKAATDAGT